jgi:hypothetical protein
MAYEPQLLSRLSEKPLRIIDRVTFLASLFPLFLMVWFPAGRAMATLSLESSFTVTETYTDNLFYEPNNKKSDFGTLFGPNLSLQYANADVVLGAAYLGRMGVFVNNPKANRTIHNVNLLLDLPFLNKLHKGLTVNIDETLQATPQLDAFSGSGAQNEVQAFRNPSGSKTRPPEEGTPSLWAGGTQGVFTTRNNSLLNRAALTVGYAWTPRVNTSSTYRNQYRRFSSSNFQDSLAHIGTFSLGYLVREGTTMTPSYSYSEINFLGGSTPSTSADKIISHNTQLSISHALTSTLRGTLGGGIAWTTQKGAKESVPGPSGIEQRSLPSKWKTNFVGSAGITKRYQQGSLNLRVGQSIGGGGGLASQATRTQTVTARISHTLTRRLNGFGSVGYAKNKSVEGNAFDTRTYRIQSGLAYVFLPWLSGNVSYSYINQNSKGSAANDITVNQFFLGVTAFADPWIPIR